MVERQAGFGLPLGALVAVLAASDGIGVSGRLMFGTGSFGHAGGQLNDRTHTAVEPRSQDKVNVETLLESGDNRQAQGKPELKPYG